MGGESEAVFMGGQKDISGFESYLEQDEKSSNTIKSYITAVRQYFSLFDDVTKQNMIAYKKKMIDKYKPKTAALRCIAMNQYCDYVGKPDCKVKSIKMPKQLSAENVPTEEEYNYFIDRLEKDGLHEYRWLIQFIAKTGARVSEVIQFERKHLESGKAEFWNKGKIRRIYIPDNLKADCKEYFDKQFTKNPECRWLFPNRYGERLTREGVRMQIKAYGEKYGMRKEILHPHAFRHLFAIQFLKRNNNIALLADLMGHESVDTTAIYLKLSEQEQKKQLDDAMNW